LNVGLRHDHYTTFGGTTNPRLALIYDPVKNTTLKLLYGAAFRAPNAYELFWHQNGVTKANPLIQPETNKTTELVLEQYLGRYVRLTTTGFYYRVSDLISQQTDPVDDLLVYNNAGAITAKGLELEAEGKLAKGQQGRISYTFQDSQDEQTGLPLTNSPRHLLQIHLITPLAGERLFAGLELQHIGSRRTIAGTEVSGAFVPNLTFFSEKLPKGMELSASLYNIFNTSYGDPGSEEHRQDIILQDGRNFRLKLTYRFLRGH
jgi:outer membrane receptor for ferrienterochelin and colicins